MHISKRLHRTIIIYSVLGMFMVGLGVGLVGVLPLTKRLREAEQQNLLVDLQKQTVAVERFLSRARSIGSGVINRTRMREAMSGYGRGEVAIDEFQTTARSQLSEMLVLATNIAGIQIYDQSSNIVFQMRADIPTNQWVWPDPASREPVMTEPFRIAMETYFVVSANILGPDLSRAGMGMVLIHGDGLRAIIQDYTDLGKTGETIIGSRQNKQLPIFFPLRQAESGTTSNPSRSNAIMEGLRRGSENSTELFEPSEPMDDSLLMACGPIKGTEWGLIVAMDKTELFSGVNRTLVRLSTVITGLILAATFGLVVVLRPLAGRVILHTDELESQIYEKTAALNTELAERKRTEISLSDSEALYHSLVDTLPINILRKDLRGRVTYGNRGYCESMGRPISELIGKSDYDLFPKELASKYLSDDEKVIKSREMFEDIEEHSSSDGEVAFVHVLKAPVFDASGSVVGTQVIFWDVTARKLAEEALGKAAAELTRSNKELEQFAYVASHDLQEPLRMVTSYTQLIARRYKDKLDEDAKEYMRFAVDGAMRMQKLIQGLLEYSRVGTRGKPFEEVNCNEVLDDALANLKLSIEESGAAVTRDTLPNLIGDPVQLTQLIQNMIGNALKFRGTAAPEIHLGAKRQVREDAAALAAPPHEWIFSVRDNGIGIEPQYFERIFVIFQRLHTQEQYAGTGIGLAICKKIVERHGGRIWLESMPGKGTTFFFAFPAME